jgi:hypothetical protein
MRDQSFTVHLCPPDYPELLFPFRCRHEGPYQMMAGARAVKGGIALDSPICMACGRPLPGTRGNVFVCVAECYGRVGFQRKIGAQLLYIRARYLRLALMLFDKNGWKGRHRKWAELLDPNLTMRVEQRGFHPDGTGFASVFVDDTYFTMEKTA